MKGRKYKPAKSVNVRYGTHFRIVTFTVGLCVTAALSRSRSSTHGEVESKVNVTVGEGCETDSVSGLRSPEGKVIPRYPFEGDERAFEFSRSQNFSRQRRGREVAH